MLKKLSLSVRPTYGIDLENSLVLTKGVRRLLLPLKKHIWAYLFMAPAVLLIGTFFIYPLIWNVVLSLSQWNLMTNTGTYVGWDNYDAIFADDVFLQALVNTTGYTALVVPLLVGVALCLALLISGKLFGLQFARAIYFIPWILPWVAAGLIWRFMYNDIYGLINHLLQALGKEEAVQFFLTRWTAILSVTAMVVWKASGYFMVILWGGLKGISPQIYEAAAIDGANPWQRFWYITLPLLKPTLSLVAILAITGSYLAFDHFFVMTGGAPANSTETILTWAYKVTFKQFQLGKGAAMSVVLLAITLTLAIIQVKYFKILKMER